MQHHNFFRSLPVLRHSTFFKYRYPPSCYVKLFTVKPCISSLKGSELLPRKVWCVCMCVWLIICFKHSCLLFDGRSGKVHGKEKALTWGNTEEVSCFLFDLTFLLIHVKDSFLTSFNHRCYYNQYYYLVF